MPHLGQHDDKNGVGFSIEKMEPGICVLSLDRPSALNALAPSFWDAFPDAIEALDAEGRTRALVVCGAGKHFCAGIDLSCLQGDGIVNTATPRDRQAAPYLIKSMQRTFTALEKARFPVIAAVHGACIGAGLELVAACDLRVCTRDTVFRLEEINVAMMADVGSLQRLPVILPEPVVKQMAFLGTALPVDLALTLGFVTELSESREAALEAALGMARQIAKKSPLAIAGSKQAIEYARDHSVQESLDWAVLIQASIWDMHEISSSVSARREKTIAQFDDLAALQSFSSSVLSS